MAEENRFAVVVEPPVAAANGLLEAMRRLAGEVGARLRGVQWVAPEHYLAPVAWVAGASLPDSAAEGLLRAARDVEELGLQVGFPHLVAEGDDAGTVVARVSSKGDELDQAVVALARALRDVGLEVAVPDGVRVTLAHVSGAEALEKIAAALGTPRDAPLAGWLSGGFWVARGPEVPGGRPWCGVRQRFVAMKRLGVRRSAPAPRPAEPLPTPEALPDAPEPVDVSNGAGEA